MYLSQHQGQRRMLCIQAVLSVMMLGCTDVAWVSQHIHPSYVGSCVQGGIVSDRWGTSIEALGLPDQSSIAASADIQAQQAHQSTQQQTEAAGHQHQAPNQTQGRKHDRRHYRGQGTRSRGRHQRGRGRGQRPGNAPAHEAVC